jgi:hypothetical protein
LISKIQEVLADIGQPDCKLISPYEVITTESGEKTLVKWLNNITNDVEIMISSDKILTLAEPNGKLLDDYLEVTK